MSHPDKPGVACTDVWCEVDGCHNSRCWRCGDALVTDEDGGGNPFRECSHDYGECVRLAAEHAKRIGTP